MIRKFNVRSKADCSVEEWLAVTTDKLRLLGVSGKTAQLDQNLNGLTLMRK